MYRVLLVDDEKMNRVVASKILKKEGFEVTEAINGKDALEQLDDNADFDLILMDLMMPEMDGFEAIRHIKTKAHLASIPIIVISALSEKESLHSALALGANDYLNKPFDLFEFRLRVGNAVKLRASLQLEELKKYERAAVTILAKAGEYKDNETSMHTVRVGELSAYFAKSLGMSTEEIEQIRLAAPMHDIGKIGITDSILLKPGKLDDAEFEQMKKHATIGGDILSLQDTPLMTIAAKIAMYHHEKYDGSGYPKGLAKESIPLEARIVAIVDVFDALLSKRPYKEPFSVEKTVAIINEGSENHFDPQLVEIFNAHKEELLAIRAHYADA